MLRPENPSDGGKRKQIFMVFAEKLRPENDGDIGSPSTNSKEKPCS